MGVRSARPAAVADGSKARNRRSAPLKAYVAGLVALSVLAAGVNIVYQRQAVAANQQLAITLAGLLVFLAAAMVFYRRIARPITKLSAGVRAAAGHTSAGPITVAGPAEVLTLVDDFNLLIT